MKEINLNEFKQALDTAGKIVAHELISNSAEFEVHEIKFTYGYSEEDDCDEINLVEIDFYIGREDLDYPEMYNPVLTLYNTKDFDLTDEQYLRGVLFGYIAALQDSQTKRSK